LTGPLQAPRIIATPVLDGGHIMGSNETARERESINAVLGPTGAIGLPAVRTLSDEYRDTPEPTDSERLPPRTRPGLVRRAMDRLAWMRGRRSIGDP
jgi:hypothetical protein